MKRKICVFTGTRAEYGLLKPLLEEIRADDDLELQIIASGMHLSPEFGLTINDVERDFRVDKKVEMLLSSDTPVGIAKSIGLGIIGFADALESLKPDILVILGDRFEALAIAIAAMVARIPIAHLYGGELTRGAIDDSIRHSITKMSYLHFTSTEEYKKRIIQLGENPSRVFNVGALGLDNIKRLRLLEKEELEKKLNFRFGKTNLLVTFHPVTLDKGLTQKQFGELLAALDELTDVKIIFTKANADTEGRIINFMIDEFVSKRPQRTTIFTSLGQLMYLSTMKHVDAVVGNSSSGIIEAPSFKIATVNIGDRQTGRIKAKSVIDCEPEKREILKAIRRALSPEFKAQIGDVTNPYGDGNAAGRIKNILKTSQFSNMKKGFFDIEFSIQDKRGAPTRNWLGNP